MTRTEIFETLNGIFRDAFDDETIILNDNTTASDIEDWDSLMQITLVSEIEQTFHIRFSMKDVIEMKNVGEMVDKIVELIQ